MTGLEDLTHDDRTLFLSPSLSVRVQHAGAFDLSSVRAAGRVLPAVPEIQGVVHQRLVPQSEIVVGVTVVISTQTTDVTLDGPDIIHMTSYTHY